MSGTLESMVNKHSSRNGLGVSVLPFSVCIQCNRTVDASCSDHVHRRHSCHQSHHLCRSRIETSESPISIFALGWVASALLIAGSWPLLSESGSSRLPGSIRHLDSSTCLLTNRNRVFRYDLRVRSNEPQLAPSATHRRCGTCANTL